MKLSRSLNMLVMASAMFLAVACGQTADQTSSSAISDKTRAAENQADRNTGASAEKTTGYERDVPPVALSGWMSKSLPEIAEGCAMGMLPPKRWCNPI